uniref:Transposase Tc1-like domain-containing protein n=1 Tax=Electrophorus electricus TaxID=8005 RepID=A0A4W4ECD4_ELEEL
MVITRMAKKHPMISSREIKEDLQLPVSTAAIRRCLREAKLFARNPRKVPLLKKRRVEKVTEHIDWPKEKWHNILWTDESKIVLIGSKGTMDQFEYIKILEEVILPYAEEEMPLKWILVDSMPHTCKAVIRNKGYTTKY